MNGPVGQKNRPYNNRLSVFNADTVNILPGTPVCLPIDLSTDGYGVVLPSTGGAAKATTLAMGISVETDPLGSQPGEYFDIVPLGWCNFTRLVRGTRAATTDAWPSFAAIGIGDVLTVNTVANALAFSATGAADKDPGSWICAGINGATATTGLTAASATTAASGAYTAFSAATAYTVGIRSFLRVL